jgi:flagellar basal body-associated protein FliL
MMKRAWLILAEGLLLLLLLGAFVLFYLFPEVPVTSGKSSHKTEQKRVPAPSATPVSMPQSSFDENSTSTNEDTLTLEELVGLSK